MDGGKIESYRQLWQRRSNIRGTRAHASAGAVTHARRQRLGNNSRAYGGATRASARGAAVEDGKYAAEERCVCGRAFGFFCHDVPMTAGVVTGRVPEMRAGARAAFSRAPRALVRTSLYLHATIRALVSRFSRSRRPPTPRRRRVQERGSQGFANRAEAHVDRRGDEVRVPRPLEVLSSIPRGLVIGGRYSRIVGVISFRVGARRRPRSRVPERSPSGLPHASAKCLQLRTTRLHTRASAP